VTEPAVVTEPGGFNPAHSSAEPPGSLTEAPVAGPDSGSAATGSGSSSATTGSGSSSAAAGSASSGAAWDSGGLVSRATGRAFFTLDGVAYACSAVVVGGVQEDVVMTAAHCVSDGSGSWAQNWTFIPGYSSGSAPYGRYVAKTFYVAGPWENGSDEDDDVAFVVVRPAVGTAAADVAAVTGSEPILFGYRSSQTAVFGYPAQAPYNGTELDYCAGDVAADPYGAADSGVSCAMTEGDSGGPWLSDFSPATGTGFITGVTSFKYANADPVIYSANLGSVAEGLYIQAEGA